MSSPVLRSILPLILLAAMGLMPAIAKAQYNVNVGSVVAEYSVFSAGPPIFETVPLVQGAGQFFLDHTVGGLSADFVLTPIVGSDTITFNATGTLANVGSSPLGAIRFDLNVFFTLQNDGVPRQSTAQLEVLAGLGGVPDGTQRFLSAGFIVERAGALLFDGSAGATLTAGTALQRFVGDFNGDAQIDANDIASWRVAFGSSTGNVPAGAEFNFPNSLDLVISLQPIPEPSEWLMVGLGLAVLGLRRFASSARL